jgi:hypothetical protein
LIAVGQQEQTADQWWRRQEAAEQWALEIFVKRASKPNRITAAFRLLSELNTVFLYNVFGFKHAADLRRMYIFPERGARSSERTFISIKENIKKRSKYLVWFCEVS